MPAVASIVLPGHTGLESSLEPANKKVSFASKELADPHHTFAARRLESASDATAAIDHHSEDGIGLPSGAISYHSGRSYLCTLSILFASLGVKPFSILPKPFAGLGFYVLSIFGLPLPEIFAGFLRIAFLPALVLCCEFFWILFAIAFVSQASQFALAFRGALSFRNSVVSSDFSCAFSFLCTRFFQVICSPSVRVEPSSLLGYVRMSFFPSLRRQTARFSSFFNRLRHQPIYRLTPAIVN